MPNSQFSIFCKEWDIDPIVPFPPVVEPDLPGAFITEHPRDVNQPHGLSIPWMTGMNSGEGVLRSARKFSFDLQMI